MKPGELRIDVEAPEEGLMPAKPKPGNVRFSRGVESAREATGCVLVESKRTIWVHTDG